MTRPVLSPLRTGRITGSRVGSILRLEGAYQSRAQVLRDMVRGFHNLPEEFQGNEMTDWGQLHEPDALAEYQASVKQPIHDGQVTVVHPFYDFLAYTPDGLVGDDGMVEAKCPYRSRKTHIDERPSHEAQIRLGLECTGRAWCDYVVWHERRPIDVSRIDYDPDWLPSVLPQLNEFMAEYQAAIADPEVLAREKGRGAKAEVSNRDRALADAARWRELQKLEVQVAEELADIKARFGEELGDTEFITVDGRPFVKWQYRAGSSRFDRAAFRTDHPALESEYSTTGTPSRYPTLIDEGETA